MVYQAGNQLLIKGLGSVNYKVVDAYAEEGQSSELDTALENGWALSPEEALDNAPQSSDGGDSALPTLEELKQKADELGINYTWNTKAETLLEKINEALSQED